VVGRGLDKELVQISNPDELAVAGLVFAGHDDVAEIDLEQIDIVGLLDQGTS
jgi:hypothetical protein